MVFWAKTRKSENILGSGSHSDFDNDSFVKGKLLFDPDGMSYYDGDWIKDKRYGWGVMRYPSGRVELEHWSQFAGLIVSDFTNFRQRV
jgi:hypothetical protein